MLRTYEEAMTLLRRDKHFFWNEGLRMFQLLNREFLDAMAEYLRGRGFVLEVGAGDGVLSRELYELGVDILATDNGSWNIDTGAGVEILDYREAIRRYQPVIVLSSWMPPRNDWTPDFRSANCVQEYILIGETDGGSCGLDSVWDEYPEFERVNLGKPSSYSLCRNDLFPGKELLPQRSFVESFRHRDNNDH